MITYPLPSVRRRAIRRARERYQAGRPHEAWQVLADAGMADYFPYFLRTAHRYARERFLREVSAA